MVASLLGSHFFTFSLSLRHIPFIALLFFLFLPVLSLAPSVSVLFLLSLISTFSLSLAFAIFSLYVRFLSSDCYHCIVIFSKSAFFSKVFFYPLLTSSILIAFISSFFVAANSAAINATRSCLLMRRLLCLLLRCGRRHLFRCRFLCCRLCRRRLLLPSRCRCTPLLRPCGCGAVTAVTATLPLP
jgi:hypothetical protein